MTEQDGGSFTSFPLDDIDSSNESGDNSTINVVCLYASKNNSVDYSFKWTLDPI